jgi:hypothetical protein
MRKRIQQHIQSNQAPELLECEKPTGAWRWVKNRDNNEIAEIDVHGDGPDEEAIAEDLNVLF